VQNKKIFLKGLSFSYIYIFVYLITGVLTTPLLLRHFEADYFALLMLIYTFITYLNNLRFGLPESLAVLLAKSNSKLHKLSLIQKTFLMLTFIVISTLCIFGFFFSFLDDWGFILGDIHQLDFHIVTTVFYILVVLALIKIPFDMALSIFIGYHEVYFEKFYRTITLVMIFLFVLYVIYTDQNIIFFALGAGIIDLFVSLFAFIHVIYRYKLQPFSRQRHKVENLLNHGLNFFQLSLTQTLMWGMGIFVVTHMLSLADVTIYSLNMKVYVYILYAYLIVNNVIAPLYGKYYAEENYKAIEILFSVTLFILPILGGLIWIGTLFFLKDIIYIWTGSDGFYVGNLFVLFMGLFFYLTGYANSYITLLYSIGKIRSIIFLKWKEVIISFFLILFLIYAIGLAGVALGMALSTLYVSMRLLPKIIMDVTSNQITFDFYFHRKHFLTLLLPSVISALFSTYFIENLFLKTIFFIVVSTFYLYSSWSIIPDKVKEYIMRQYFQREYKN
jgi:O-antigen/teichoic acid export membrane protein